MDGKARHAGDSPRLPLPAWCKTKSGARKCPGCGGRKGAVIDSRPFEAGLGRVRRLACGDCGLRWTTHETIVTDDVRSFNIREWIGVEYACD